MSIGLTNQKAQEAKLQTLYEALNRFGENMSDLSYDAQNEQEEQAILLGRLEANTEMMSAVIDLIKRTNRVSGM